LPGNLVRIATGVTVTAQGAEKPGWTKAEKSLTPKLFAGEDLANRVKSMRIARFPAIIVILSLGLICVFFLSHLFAHAQRNAATTAPATAGRYRIVFSPHVRADTFLLDTETGRIWRQTEVTDLKDKPTVWIPQKRFDSELDLTTWEATQLRTTQSENQK